MRGNIPGDVALKILFFTSAVSCLIDNLKSGQPYAPELLDLLQKQIEGIMEYDEVNDFIGKAVEEFVEAELKDVADEAR